MITESIVALVEQELLVRNNHDKLVATLSIIHDTVNIFYF